MIREMGSQFICTRSPLSDFNVLPRFPPFCRFGSQPGVIAGGELGAAVAPLRLLVDRAVGDGAQLPDRSGRRGCG